MSILTIDFETRSAADLRKTGEIWKDVPGHEGCYQVSSLGRVRSLDRWQTGTWGRGDTQKTRLVRGVMLKAYVNTARGGYRYVNLSKDGRQSMRRVAGLVALAFLGPRPKGQQVCHANGVAADDRLENLRYDTATANAADKRRHGTHLAGERHSSARLTEADVRRVLTGGEATNALARELGVHPGHINNIRRGARWSHV